MTSFFSPCTHFFFFNDTATPEIYTLSLHGRSSDLSNPCVRVRRLTSESWSLRGARLFSRGDRKSTRLNSSHMSISYAVFCLKKKMRSTELQQLVYHNTHTELVNTCHSQHWS